MMIFDLWTPPTTKNYLPVTVVRLGGVGGRSCLLPEEGIKDVLRGCPSAVPAG